MLRHPCVLGGPQQRGKKSKVAPSPLPSHRPKRGRKCYVTPAFSGSPQQMGTETELATSHLPSRGPNRGQKCYIAPAFLKIPNARRSGQNQELSAIKRKKIRCVSRQRGTKSQLPTSPPPSPGPKRGRKCYVRESPPKENIIRTRYRTQPFPGAQKRAEMVSHPCILGGPHQRGTKSEHATSPLPSRGPKRGRKCDVKSAL